VIFDAPRPPRRAQDRAIVPMINVVFLLLIFFLMTASLSPPPPLEITPPEARTDPADRQRGTLYIAADGTLAFEGATGPAALAALAAAPTGAALPVLADAEYPAAELARLLPRLAEAGVTDLRLVTVQP
jgi:biopolymer transport protein ExbD